MAVISVRELTLDNIYKCINLNLDESQKNRIAPNVYSIAESKVNPNYTPYVIYADQDVIGFAMVDYDPTLDGEDKYWVPRFMIDVRQQGKGYGKEAMKQIIHMLKEAPDCERIRLSTEPDNIPAIKFYESIGFKNTGKLLEESEVILELLL
ncbi:GNAT family N-acetyltransferase [Bacillus sp. 31A1R]|uniref:GNAT family N-acetyltransferase n=1 Tax=Robertmurraya mangrovi TaxID=3098077 RepID=A0ABU5J302_9BACI|nr:GNAT family N-acetyltransferase [Bacillus sp. 31A1R]MDZ5473740.1 GNAT family N-acetyltransferase [Bacillus sp. 31A1R]